MKWQIPHESINFWLLALLIIFYPIHVKASNAILILFGVHWLFWLLKKPDRFNWKNGFVWLLLIPYLLVVLSLLYTTNTAAGIYVLDKKIALFILPLALGTMPQISATDVRKLMLIAIVSVAIALLVCILFAAFRQMNDHPGAFFWEAFTAPLDGFHPTYLSLYINVLIAYLGYYALENTGRLTVLARVCISGIIGLFCVAQILLSSKIQLLCSLLLLSFLVINFSRIFNMKIVVPILLIFIVVTGYFLRSSYTWERFTHITTFQYQLDAPTKTFNELTIRFGIFECAIDVVKENPVLGVGAGDVKEELYRAYRNNDFKFGYLDSLNPHNEYLSHLLAFGTVGLSLFLIVLFTLLYYAFRRRDIVFILFLSLVMVSFMFESMLERNKGTILFALFSSLLLFHHGTTKVNNKVDSNEQS